MKEIYTKLMEKKKLPPYEEMDHEFELSKIENEEHYLRNVRQKMNDKIENVLGILDDILHPESSWSSMVEEKIFSEEEGKKILQEYKRLRYYYRWNSELKVMDSDEKNIEFIKTFFEEWKDMQKKIIIVAAKLKDAWTQELTKKEKLGYLG